MVDRLRLSRRLLVFALPVFVVLALIAACTAPSPPAVPPGRPAARTLRPVELHPAKQWESAATVLSGGLPAPYNYGPTVVAESSSHYRAWWCSQLPGVGPAGDDILHAESDRLDGGFAATGGAPAVPVFDAEPGGFDAMHTCDPSVLKTGGRYYLYYTGAAGSHAHGNAIGVASSDDGSAWRREGGGAPIVTASGEVHRQNDYGAGQPSALYLDGWYYLLFTDTTASGAGWNGAGQFVLRARDAAFSDRVQALTASGFRPTGPDARVRSRSVVDAFSADWMWVDALQAFAIAHQTAGGTAITFWDRDFTRHPYEPLLLPGPWQEGPGLVRGADGHAPVSEQDPCGSAPIAVLRATAANPAPTDVRSSSVDVTGVDGCAEPERARALLESFGAPAPERAVDVLRGGVKVRVERRSVAETMVRAVLDERVPAWDRLPVAGVLRSGAPAVRSPSGELGLVDDQGRVWTVGPATVVANGSTVAELDQRAWDSRSHAGDLR